MWKPPDYREFVTMNEAAPMLCIPAKKIKWMWKNGLLPGVYSWRGNAYISTKWLMELKKEVESIEC